MSHYLYLSEDVDPKWIKVGVRITPYSAIRAYQRNTAREIAIQHLYFGRPRHIKQVERFVKEHFKPVSGAVLLQKGQTELFKTSFSALVEFIDTTIDKHKFHCKKIKLDEPYTATNSSSCPLRSPSESYAEHDLSIAVERIWGADPMESWMNTFFDFEGDISPQKIKTKEKY